MGCVVAADVCGLQPSPASFRRPFVTAPACRYFADQPAPVAKTTPAQQLYEAAAAGSADLVASLIREGVDIHSVNQAGNKAIHIAACTDAPRLCTCEVVGVRAVLTPGRACADEGHVSVLQALVDAGANVNDLGRGNNTPLHFAARNNHASAVEFLMVHGADATAQNWRALEPAQVAGDPEIGRIIFQGIDGASSGSPLHTNITTPSPVPGRVHAGAAPTPVVATPTPIAPPLGPAGAVLTPPTTTTTTTTTAPAAEPVTAGASVTAPLPVATTPSPNVPEVTVSPAAAPPTLPAPEGSPKAAATVSPDPEP